MITITKIKSRIRKKTNPYLAETIRLALKHPKWMEIAKILSGSTRKHPSLNLKEIDEKSSIGDTIIVPGKILSQGELKKRIKVSAIAISSQAKDKLKHSKSEFVHLNEEIKKNPKAEGIKILR